MAAEVGELIKSQQTLWLKQKEQYAIARSKALGLDKPPPPPGPKQFDGTASKEAIAQARAMTLAQASAQGGKMRSPNFLTQRRK
mmetsp:Transcript_54858/g.128247  ORF Transcript_54858/g.128247 Transcript_54858/m.128247 type:complete len:84 (-) Transcript_54858:141-392(-)